MKKTLFIIIMALIGGSFAKAQTPAKPLKIGYIDVDYVLSEMPETKQIESELQVHQNQLQTQLQSKMANYQKMIQDYQAGAAAMTDVIRADKEREISQLEQNIQQFQQDAQVSLQKKSADLLQPVYDKIGKAIDVVAAEQQYTYVFSQRVGSVDVLLYFPPENDISDLVLKNMGITPKSGN